MPKSLEPAWWHVVWTTFLCWSPADPRGDWSSLSRAYSELMERHGGVEMAASLEQRWQHKSDADGAVVLSPLARELVARSIRELTDSDRVAGDTPVRALAVGAQSVQIVIACPQDALHQRIGRLKSRTATLLSFDPAAGVGGKGTWSRGFWWARLANDEMVSTIEGFVKGSGSH